VLIDLNEKEQEGASEDSWSTDGVLKFSVERNNQLPYASSGAKII